MGKFPISVLITAALVTAPAAARERLLAPTDDWTIEAASESCVLTRNFRDPAGDELRFRMYGYRPGDFKITMVGAALPLRHAGRRGIATIDYRFKPDRDWREAVGVTGRVGGEDFLTFYANFAASDQVETWRRVAEAGGGGDLRQYFRDRAAEVDQLALAYPQRDDTVLQLGPMIEPYDDLQACVRELPRGWGYDPATIAALQSGPRLLNWKDVGRPILNALRDAKIRYVDTIHFRVDVDEHGSVSGCVVQYPQRTDATEATVCGLLRERARFEPALDTSGKPRAAPLVSSISYVVG